ncbi:phosphoadenosine phosphosulfate reductase family protein [Escherichia coli]
MNNRAVAEFTGAGNRRGVFKVLPIIDWDNRTIYQYLQKHGLKYHHYGMKDIYRSVIPIQPVNGNLAFEKKHVSLA